MVKEASANSRHIVGGIVTFVGGLVTALAAIIFLFSEYVTILKGFQAAGKLPGVVLQSIEQPMFAQLLVVSGVMLIVSSYGFFTKRDWAWILGFVASILGIFGGWMLSMFPLMVLLPMKHMLTFMTNAIVFFVLTLYVKPQSPKIVAASFLAGIAFTMNFMNGNAALNKWIGSELQLTARNPEAAHVAITKMMTGNPGLIFESIQRALWLVALAFLVICIALIFRRDWILPIGLTASIVSIIAGTPVGWLDTFVDKGGEKMSMFFFAPILSVFILLALLIWKEKIWSDETTTTTNTQQVSS